MPVTFPLRSYQRMQGTGERPTDRPPLHDCPAVLVGPAVAPDPSEDTAAQRLAAVSIPSVWGDYIAESTRWRTLHARFQAFDALLERAGVVHDSLDLPDVGITGNSHFPMCDRNAETVRRRVHGWLSDVCIARTGQSAPRCDQDAPPHQHKRNGRTP